MATTDAHEIPAFDRAFFTGKEQFTRIGTGSIGGKAQGLARVADVLASALAPELSAQVAVRIPTLTVIATQFFDLFLEDNDLHDVALADTRDDLIAHAFQRAELSPQLVGDLRALVEQVRSPLAVRSSSMLEDAMFEPFASVYTTKMIPNNQQDVDTRFRKLVEAVKYVYASTFFGNAKSYIRATRHQTTDEKMAVILQEVVGTRHGSRYYPQISGVARSYNFYPLGHARPSEGVIDLAIGLGKTVVDDGVAWSYSPSYPHANPPYNAVRDLLKQTQTRFWAVHMGEPAAYDPIRETEYIVQYDLADAEADGTLAFVASTYRATDDRIVMGTRTPGPRIVDFGPILKGEQVPLNEVLRRLLKACEEALGCMVEVEFAATLDEARGVPARLGFLQVRPMVLTHDIVDIGPQDLLGERTVVACESVLGNGIVDSVRDVVYVKPETFHITRTTEIAHELGEVNGTLLAEGRPYVLLGFGRWGSSDPQGGIPVNFGQISGARAIVEIALPDGSGMLSQGSHFFHNITSFKVCYFSVEYEQRHRIDWDWLRRQKVAHETDLLRLIRLDGPLEIRVDGRTGRGVIRHD
ncbi:MAG: hypothetical protein JXQ29_00080 [Planctomycetes bacterium]|nr:hypothetical protein [Planctomycetota bacterium]